MSTDAEEEEVDVENYEGLTLCSLSFKTSPTDNDRSVIRREEKCARAEAKFIHRQKTQEDRIKRAKQRHVDAWNALTQEQKDQHKEDRKTRMEAIERRLNQALISGLNVCIDLSYDTDSQHSEKEQKSLGKQLSLSYAQIKKSEVPIHLHITSFTEDSVTGKSIISQGAKFWKASLHAENPSEIFPKNQLIYLSPDAEEPLTCFEYDKIYVIGGIVDRSVRKALTLSRAEQLEVTSRRLPLQEYIPERRTHILNVDTMVNVISTYLETEDWGETLRRAVPLRIQSKREKKSVRRKGQAIQATGEDDMFS